MKKILGLVLVIVLTFALLAACAQTPDDPAPADTPASADTPTAPADTAPPPAGEGQDSWLVPERTTIHLAAYLDPGWAHPTESSFWEWLEDYTNVAVDWTTFLAGEQLEQFALMMASGELPDAFIGGLGGDTTNLLLYGVELGIYIPLNDLIDQYAPNFLRRGIAERPDLLSLLTAPDGNIYSLPRLHLNNPYDQVYNTMAINQTWLDALGLEPPRTIEEVEEVLIAFRDGDPDGIIPAGGVPLSFLFSCWGAADPGPWFAPFGAPLVAPIDGREGGFVLIENDVVTFQGAQEYFRDGARWLASLYAQGLIDLEVFTYDQAAYRARAGGDPNGLFGIWSSWSPWSDAGDAGVNYHTLLAPIQGPAGASSRIDLNLPMSRDTFMITNQASDPELLIRWVDIFYRDLETSLRASEGQGPDPNKTWYITDAGLIRMVPHDLRNPEAIRGQNELPFAPSIIGRELNERLAPELEPNLKAEHNREVVWPYVQNFLNGTWATWPTIFMLPEEADELSFIEADLLPFTSRMLASWIAGERNVDEDWEQYLQDLNAYGLERWLEIRQTVYNRFLAG